MLPDLLNSVLLLRFWALENVKHGPVQNIVQLLLEKLDYLAPILAIVLQLLLRQYAYHVQNLAYAQQADYLEDQVFETLHDVACCSTKHFLLPSLNLVHH